MKKYITLILLALLATANVVVATDGNGVSQDATTGIWYTTTYPDEFQVRNKWSVAKNLDINILYPSNYVSFEAKVQWSATNKTFSLDEYIEPSWTTKYITGKQETSWSSHNNISISTSATQIAIKSNGGSERHYVRNIKVQMAPHIRLKDTPASHDFGSLEHGFSSAALAVNFQSFLSSGTLSVKIKGTNSEAFRVSNYINAANNTLSQIDNTSNDFTVTYDPNSIGSHSAIIEISDNVNKVEINVSGQCVKKTPSLTWNISNFKFAAGDTIISPATSNPAAPITYSTADNSIVKISGDTLFAIGSGDVEISASVAEQDYYNAATITQIFTVTNKTIQYIDWAHQNFYLLKLGDADQQLTAVAKDKLTDQANGNTITYTSSDENVVKIEGSTLKIIGKGRASITAAVEETEIYAGAVATKVVFVRETSDDCSTTFAVADTETYSKSYSAWYESITKTFEWQDIVGETLTFTATGNIDFDNFHATDNTNNKRIELTSDGNTYTGKIDRNTRKITIFVEGKLCSLVWETYTISLSNIFVTPASYIEPQRSEISFSATEIGKTASESVAVDWANQPDFIRASIVDDATGAFSIDPNFATIIGMCGMSGSSNIKVLFNPKTEGQHSAKMVLKVGEKDEVWATVPLSGEGIYCETQFVHDGNWNDINNWTNGIPGGGKNTIVKANTTIPDNYTAEVNDMRIDDNGKITIAPKGTLKVAASLNNTTTKNLILQANNQGSATLLFNNPADNKVNATVELYSLASSDGLRNGEAGNFKDPKWQYLGVVAEEVNYSVLNADGTSNWIYRWDETQNATSCWAEKLSSASILNAWTGYCLAQEKATTYTYSGALVNENHTYNLTYSGTETDPNRGKNLITNSYTAPIDITTLSANNFVNAEATIYIYNTGSYNEWKEQTELLGFGPGQMVAIPVETANKLASEYPRTIASGQAFFVSANGSGASFMVDYEKNVFGSDKKENVKRARLSDTSDTSDTSERSDHSDQSDNSNIFLNVLKLQVTSSTSNDRLYLLEHEGTTTNFDNGYDAAKIFDNPKGPQIYATTEFGAASISTSESFVGQVVGFVANDENELYTMSFNTTKVTTYTELYLYDTETEIYTDILNEEIYQFYGSKTPNNGRFVITTYNPNKTTEENPTTDIESITTQEDILSSGKPIYLYSITGQLIGECQELSTLNSQHSTLPEGVYIIKCSEKTIKITF